LPAGDSHTRHRPLSENLARLVVHGTRERLRVAYEAVESEWYIATRARIVRKYVPWEVLAEMLFGRGAK
jgi:hypothetical protein